MTDNMAQPSDTDDEGRNWRALVEAARAIHQPSVLAAGEYEDGTCAYCVDRPDRPVLERYRDHLNGSSKKVWMHAHRDDYPICSTCAAGYEDRQNWPCETAAALGMSEA